MVKDYAVKIYGVWIKFRSTSSCDAFLEAYEKFGVLPTAAWTWEAVTKGLIL